MPVSLGINRAVHGTLAHRNPIGGFLGKLWRRAARSINSGIDYVKGAAKSVTDAYENNNVFRMGTQLLRHGLNYIPYGGVVGVMADKVGGSLYHIAGMPHVSEDVFG